MLLIDNVTYLQFHLGLNELKVSCLSDLWIIVQHLISQDIYSSCLGMHNTSCSVSLKLI